MSLHNEIMNLPVVFNQGEFANRNEYLRYKEGHRDARHEAAQLGVKYDKLNHDVKEYKALIEKVLKEYQNPDSVPFGMDPHSHAGVAYRQNKREILNWCLEMLPEVE